MVSEQAKAFPVGSLGARLNYLPQTLKFGTSGRRGEVAHLTQLEIYINALAELQYLQSLSQAEGGILPGDPFYFACDLRPSSSQFVPEQQGRGELAQAIEQAIRDAGLLPVNLGRLPTPALTYYALQHGKGSIMITGSHIPFERNGYKTNSAKGELMKKDEIPINQRVERVRIRLYAQPFEQSLFNELGMFRTGHRELSTESQAARDAYLKRYLDFFSGRSLKGKRLLVYQHSAVGRDLLPDILEAFSADVIPAGRSETFVPIDTENVEDEQLDKIQRLAADATLLHGPLDAVVSTDGDSDRPLIVGVDYDRSGLPRVQFFGGDLVGMMVADYLQADSVVVPISCNDAIDRGALSRRLEPKTRIGSPYVIAGMQKAKGQRICGWESNGGFLLGSDIARDGRILKALPTRDALLPILAILFSMTEQNTTLKGLFAGLPQRFSRAALLKEFPRTVSHQLIERFSPADNRVKEAVIESNGPITFLDEDMKPVQISESEMDRFVGICQTLQSIFSSNTGFGRIVKLNYLDGVRVYFDNGEIAHFRPSGNADELRIYAVAGLQTRADAIARLSIAEPDGILRQLEKASVG